MPTITQPSLVRNPSPKAPQPSIEKLRQDLRRSCKSIETLTRDWSKRSDPVSFKDFELFLRETLYAVGRAALVLFLALRERQVMRSHPRHVVRGGRRFRQAPAQSRALTTLFGVVRYWRSYFREVAEGNSQGFYPLDCALGLVTDRFSWNVLSRAVVLATKLSFAEAREVLSLYQPHAPSTEVMQKAVLGLGHYTADWFAQAPPPEDDGDVLVIMIDSKGVPTATESELKRRRGKRKKQRLPKSPRHRGRARRWRHGRKPRPKTGDKSKNAKMSTLVVMYTLKRNGPYLLGPRNRWVYASFAPKRHAFEIARREADKRGFNADSGKQVHLVTDGDKDLECYAAEIFPEARHTIDVIHVIEKLWIAGECLYPSGSEKLAAWVERQKERLYGGDEEAIVDELYYRRSRIPRTGPGNKGKRTRLAEVRKYIEKRLHLMGYEELMDLDMDIGSGPVEGAVKNIIGKRCDYGGMRWIKERSEALLQLRCIEANGDWDNFINYVHNETQAESQRTAIRQRLQRDAPDPLPKLAMAA
jgi:hypothetical protein